MDVTRFKDTIRRLGIFRNYSPLLVPVVIAVVAGLVLIPAQLISGKLRKQMASESVSMGGRVRSLGKTAPARDQWKVEQAYQQAYEEDANQMALLAKQSSQRQLLSYKIFPEPKDTSTLIFGEFGQRFRSGIEQLLGRINARDCPTEVELGKNLVGGSALSGRSVGGRRSSMNMSEVEATITDALCRAKAESASVYATATGLSGYDFWADYKYAGMEQAVKDCWYWQLGYWITEDVIDTIAACNSGSARVFTSPVKRLVSVSFTTSSGRSSRRTVGDRPGYVLSVGDGLTAFFTGRFCNNDIDVVHFNVVVVVSAKAVLPFMQKLCSAKKHTFQGFFGELEPAQTFKHNQITILESSIDSVDPDSDEHMLYRYGDDAVVELSLVCEYIFNKNGYDEVKPESVKKEIKPQ
jgi:hypothetical protein